MNNLQLFLTNEYKKALLLSNEFSKLPNKEWNSLIVLLELNVQIGHVFNTFNHDEDITEINRPINNLGDELSDVLLQLCYLLYLEKIELNSLDEYQNYQYSHLDGLSILFGQLTEALLEKYGYRFSKDRTNFADINAFIKDRIVKVFIIVLKMADYYNLNMNKEFDDMYEDADNFVKRKIANGNARHI